MQKAAEEQDKLLCAESQIDLKQSHDAMQISLKEATQELQADDEVSKESIKVLVELWKDSDGELMKLSEQEDYKDILEVFGTLGILSEVEDIQISRKPALRILRKKIPWLTKGKMLKC